MGGIRKGLNTPAVRNNLRAAKSQAMASLQKQALDRQGTKTAGKNGNASKRSKPKGL
jgi:hypothetical protein